jgi:DNA-binding NarL/FixJ family response regulator
VEDGPRIDDEDRGEVSERSRSLPAQRVGRQPPPLRHGSSTRAKHARSRPELGEPTRHRVLLADPDRAARAACRRRLEEDGRFRVCAEVDDAPAAISAALHRDPDLCLVEDRLPGGAVEAIWEIAARLPHVRVVLRATRLDHDELVAALRAGAAGYLLRSGDDARLPETLARVLAGEMAVPRASVARLLEGLRNHAPRRRSIVVGGVRSPLTSREWEVFDLLCEGSTTAEIAETLMISKATVRSHIASVLRKLQVPDRAAAIELCGRLR